MTPYYEGTSEAEHLIRGTPELVEAWLKKAKRDRGRLGTRLFQPQKKEFLDGFINSLEHHLTLATNRNTGSVPEPIPVATMPAQPLEMMSEGAVEIQGRATTTTTVVDELPLDDPSDSVLLCTESTDPPPAFESVLDREEPRQDQGDSPPDLIDATFSAEVVPILDVEDSVAPTAALESDAETEVALGVLRLSGWTVEQEYDSEESGGPDEAAANLHHDACIQTGEPVNAVEWGRVFEQARGVGMVDLSAYDFIDGLGELRDLIDRWHYLHQDTSAIENP